MKKIKQIMAISGIILLVGLYLTTFILSITDNSESMKFFYASVYATVVIPVLIWAYTFIYKLVHKNSGQEEPETSEETTE